MESLKFYMKSIYSDLQADQPDVAWMRAIM